MNYQLIEEVIALVGKFDANKDSKSYTNDLSGFKQWVANVEVDTSHHIQEPHWEGKEEGRSAESVINTLIVHMNRYAKTYSKSAIHESGFSTQEDFIYLINLKAFGTMSKTDLIKKNIQDKPVGMQIINRLIKQGWVQQSDSLEDKRSKIISITPEGTTALSKNMHKIRQATQIVTGNLTQTEKIQLINLLQKLDGFHQPIYAKNLEPSQLIGVAYQEYLSHNN
ncbi:MAG TPA: MarR family winged helix-turn-helix transcriptional regulator [Flavobacterium sp.]|nr:MarR family winged helix-turn-helix transcriptional regulator [Flavobacterium sp.]